MSGRFCGILRGSACVQVPLACAAGIKHCVCFVLRACSFLKGFLYFVPSSERMRSQAASYPGWSLILLANIHLVFFLLVSPNEQPIFSITKLLMPWGYAVLIGQ